MLMMPRKLLKLRILLKGWRTIDVKLTQPKNLQAAMQAARVVAELRQDPLEAISSLVVEQ